MATNIRCPYCNEAVLQAEYNSHMREKHATPTVQDLCRAKENYALYYAMYHQQRSKPTPAAPKPPSTSSSSDTTLQGSATSDSAKMSTTFSAWQQQNKFAVTQSVQCITADDVSSFRVDRSDQPRTAARSLQKSTKYDIQEFVSEFQELENEDREKCNDLIRKLPVFAVSVTSRYCYSGFRSYARLVSERLYLYALEIMCGREAKVRVEIQ